MNDSYDVIVVGAGPAGSLAAKTAAEKGASVLLLDRRKEFGAPVRCGEGIGLHWVNELKLKINPKAISAEISGAALYGPDLKTRLVVRDDESKGFVLDRKVFDKDLAHDAGRAGVEIKAKTDVVDLLKEGKKIIGVKAKTLEGETIEVKSKVVVDAEGGESLLARLAGLNAIATLYDTDFGVEYEMVNVECEDLIEIYFSNEFSPRGYVWIFPKGKDVANVGVGIGGLNSPNAVHYLNKFLADARVKERLGKAQAVAIKGGLIPVGAPLEKMTADGFMVVGTAAHQVDPIHGGGICLALDAGMIGGRVAAECALNGKTGEKDLSAYETEWRAKREKKLLKRLKLRKTLEKLNDNDLKAIFENLNDADVARLLKGDYAPVVKKVLIKRPQLLKVLSTLV